MKVVGIVLLALLGSMTLLIALLLLVPVGVQAAYRNKAFSLRIRILFFRFTVCPRKKKKRPAKKKEEAKKRKKQPGGKKKKEKKEKKKISLKRIKKLLTKHLPPILSCFYISRMHIRWEVHADDAGDTAIRYGAVSSIAAGVLAILDRLSGRLKHAEVDILPNYDEGSFEGDVTVSITVGKLAISVVRLLIDLTKNHVL